MERTVGSNGTESLSETTVTVINIRPPIIQLSASAPSAVACSTGGPIHLPLPVVVDACSPSRQLSGKVISVNGASASIPLANDGSVTVGPGVIVVQWTAVDAAGFTFLGENEDRVPFCGNGAAPGSNGR